MHNSLIGNLQSNDLFGLYVRGNVDFKITLLLILCIPLSCIHWHLFVTLIPILSYCLAGSSSCCLYGSLCLPIRQMKVNSDVANNKNKGIKIPVLSAFLLLVHLINLYVTPQIQKFISKENLTLFLPGTSYRKGQSVNNVGLI